MPYDAEISRRNPTAFFFVIDQSGSMNEQQGSADGNPGGVKKDNLASIMNNILNNVVIRSDKGTEIFRYFEVALIGYGNDELGPTMVGSAFGGNLKGRDIVWIDELADNPIEIRTVKKKQ